MTRIAAVEVVDHTVSVSLDDDRVVELATVWLRDACRCALCRNPETGLRREVEGFHRHDVEATVARAADDGRALRLVWHDGHETTIDASWLARSTVDRPDTGPCADDHALWRSSVDFARSDHEALADPTELLRWLEALWRDGVALIRGMPPTREALRALAERIGPIRASNYGPDWQIEASPTPDTPVDSTQSLRVHTDLPYRDVPPGVQFNLSAVADATGGNATLADGFAVADALRRTDARAFETLTRVDVPVGYFAGGHDLRLSAPPIALDGRGRPRLIRYAPGLVGQVTSDPDTTREAYRAYRLFTEMANDPEFLVEVELRPGDLIAMHNHRVLHGRTELDLSSGRRLLLGCYLDVDDLLSTIRVLRRRSPAPM